MDLRVTTTTVVVVTSNRRLNLALALKALAQQTSSDFAVVVVDDGSSDGTREMIGELAATTHWRGRLRWVAAALDPAGSSRARNIGAANAAPGSSLLVFMDSDVLPARDVVSKFSHVHARVPAAAVFGTVHWLPPLDVADVARRLDRAGTEGLLSEVPGKDAERVEGTIVGPDPRPPESFSSSTEPVEGTLRPELTLFGCAAIGLRQWRDAGGFDERLRGYGYEDMELGIRLARRGVRGVLLADVVALHVWHRRDWATQALEAERNLDYVLRKHGPDATSDHWADWSVWWHYHAERGGRVVRDGAGALWAVDRRSRFRLALPSEAWVTRLGHTTSERCDARELDGLKHSGQARQLAFEREG